LSRKIAASSELEAAPQPIFLDEQPLKWLHQFPAHATHSNLVMVKKKRFFGANLAFQIA
jgi:hypothetical protein